jgi:signal transduction histidine kinase
LESIAGRASVVRISSRAALVIFIVLTVVAFAQAVWWTAFMARLVDEKVEIAEQLGASQKMIADISSQEIQRQIMVGTEGVFFLVLILVGAWLIYRSLVHAETLKFQQQNFLMAITHELKTPLASIQMSLDALMSDKISEERKASLTPRIQEDLNRLERIIDHILNSARFERGRLHLQLQTLELEVLLQTVLDRLEKSNHDVRLDIVRDLQKNVQVEADPVALRTVLEAVLDNAVRYRTGGDVRIEISMSVHGKSAKVSIKDRGAGLAKDDQKAIFERFYRVGNELTRQTSGSGLGLYLARELMRAQDGSIHALSEGPGKGTTIVIKLGVKNS